MSGYHGKLLMLDMTSKTASNFEYPKEWETKYIGGRGFAVKLLWDNVPAGTDPYSSENWLVFTIGPLSGLMLPSSSKMIVASKSPLTGGYGDGNLGTRASPQLKKAGYDGIIVKGKSDSPVYVVIKDDNIEFKDATAIWGKGTYATEDYLIKKYGKKSGFLSIGQGGENLVKFATVRSQEGRSGGRPGMGAVMGSKMLKSIVVVGTGKMPVFDAASTKKMGSDGYKDVKKADFYPDWMRMGTTLILEFLQETSTLPVNNFSAGTFPKAKEVDGDKLGELKTTQYGCPRCNMQCGMVIKDAEGHDSELDYENIGMLGPNIGIGDMPLVGVLNWMADDYGLDTISLGSVLGMAAEAAKNDVLGDDYGFGNFEKSKELITRITMRSDPIGDLLAEGTMRMAEKWGDVAKNWAIHVKGLEASAYNAGTVPGMALSFGTSPIGAHHKDAWVIQWEIQHSKREAYTEDKAAKVIELQRIRGGMFESLVTCRFPWIELGYNLDNYPKFLQKVTGREDWDIDEVFEVADRIYALMRAFWVREFHADGKKWERSMDYPPSRWFNEGLKEGGTFTGQNLDIKEYNSLLDHYYQLRKWDSNGIPTKEIMQELSLNEEATKLEKYVKLN